MEVCTKCQKELKNKVGLIGHMRSHAKDEPAAPVAAPQIPVEAPVARTLAPEVVKTDFTKYKLLPPPIVEHLEKTYGNWLNLFDIGQVYKEDFGGYGIYITVPKQFSTEWKEGTVVLYGEGEDFKKKLGEKKVEIPDTRWKSLVDLSKAKKWLDLVKNNIITSAYRKGIPLPSTNTGLDETKQTFDEYKKAIEQK